SRRRHTRCYRDWSSDVALPISHPDWSRRRLSEALCEQWNWCNGAGLRKDMAARTLLLKLHQRGLIALPARRQIPTNRMRTRVLRSEERRVGKECRAGWAAGCLG